MMGALGLLKSVESDEVASMVKFSPRKMRYCDKGAFCEGVMSGSTKIKI